MQVILLDTRYLRSPLKKRDKTAPDAGPYLPSDDPNATFLGETQWKWLEEQLKVPAKLRILASSIQVVAEDHGWEKWMNFPRERERLFKLIRDTKANGVVLISGDRHLAELSLMDAGIGYPLYDLTSSGLNQASSRWRPLEENKHRVSTMNVGNNFGLIAIDWDRPEPLISLQIRDEDGDITIQQKVSLGLLQPGGLKEKVSAVPKIVDTGAPLSAEEIKKRVNEKVTLELTVQATGMSTTLLFLNSAPDRRSRGQLHGGAGEGGCGRLQASGHHGPAGALQGQDDSRHWNALTLPRAAADQGGGSETD